MAEVLFAAASTGVVKSLAGKLAKLLGDEYNLLTDVRSDVEFLQRDLQGMDEMLRGLPARGKLGAATNQWRTKWQEMAYHIEDGIDDFMQQLGCAGDKDGFMRDVAKQLNLKVRHQISRQIQELKALVAEEGARDKQFNMRLLPELAGMSMDEQYISVQKIDPRVMALYTDADHQLVGMDGPVDEILELLTLGGENSAAQQLQIVSIIGPGGLGKTTLANQVHRKIKGQFDYTVLVSVSERPNMKEILRKILPPGLSRGDSSEVCQLAADARKYLEDKRYLIVFDDIWNTGTWDDLKSILPVNNNKKSRVITTTRNSEVAASCCSKPIDHIHKMDPLDEPHSEELFFRRIFSTRSCPKALNEAAKKILKKCGGIPLAIITIGGMLAAKPKSKAEWKRVQSSIGNASELEGMIKTLLLSFDDLSYDLRNCLLSLSAFPEDYEIDREMLVFKWIAEGFVFGKGEDDLVQIGKNYFNQLINRSLIQPVDIQYNGLARACRVHDLMLDLIVSESKKQNFATISDRLGCPNSVRWLSFHCGEDKVTKVISENDMCHVRSLSFFPPTTQLPPLKKFQALRVLDVKGCQFLKQQILEGIARLIHLKYLNLSDTNVKKLPKEIGAMQCLETLDIRNSGIETLPEALCKLKNLVRLFVSSGVTLPDNIGKMKALQELSNIAILCNSLKLVEQLGQLTELRVLRLDCRYSWLQGKKRTRLHDRKYDASLLSSLRKLGGHNLQALEVDLADNSMVFSLMDSSCAFPQLEELIMSNFIPRVPRGMVSLEDLLHLEIKLDRMKEDDLQILRDMSASLLFLRIDLVGAQEKRLVIEGFECLKQFEFCCDGMGLKFAVGAMPELEKLDLDVGVRTTVSKYGGFEFGIKNLEALKHVSVKLNCRSAERIEIQAAESAIRNGVIARRLMPQIQRTG